MKRRPRHGMLALVTRVGNKADLLWCFEPEKQSGPGIATNPRLLPPLIGEHVKQTVVSPMPSGAESTRVNALDTMLASEVPID